MNKKVIISISSAVVIVIIAAIVYTITHSTNSADTAADQTSSEPVNTTQPSLDSSKKSVRLNFDKGETMIIGKLELKVDKVTRNYDSKDRTAREGYEIIRVDMTLDNKGVTGLCHYHTDFSINYGGDELSKTAFIEKETDLLGHENPDSCLKPDKPIIREVTYEIPAGADNLKLQFEERKMTNFDEKTNEVTYEKLIYTLKI